MTKEQQATPFYHNPGRTPVMEVHVNYLAVLVAAIASYVIAAVWYGMIFRKAWSQLTNIADMKQAAKNIVIVFVATLIMSFVLDHSIAFGNAYVQTSGVSGGLQGGFYNWLGFVAPVTLMGVVYEKRPWKLWLLDNGFWLLSLLVMGAILSAWT
jgi:hypothetical protein